MKHDDTMTEAERVEFLDSVKLPSKGKSLAPETTEDTEIVLAPPGVDPRAMPVDEIVFDPRLLDKFPSLEGREASDYVFALYKSYMKGDRNKVLWAKVGKFVEATKMQRKAPGFIKEVVKTTAEQRALAQVIAATGLTAEDLAKIIQEKS